MKNDFSFRLLFFFHCDCFSFHLAQLKSQLEKKMPELSSGFRDEIMLCNFRSFYPIQFDKWENRSIKTDICLIVHYAGMIIFYRGQMLTQNYLCNAYKTKVMATFCHRLQFIKHLCDQLNLFPITQCRVQQQQTPVASTKKG